jgi:hypothetical protein
MSCTLRRNKEAMIKTLKEEYEKRGRPLDSTGWSPKEVRQFMSWQFEVQKPKKKDKIGGFSWLLPEKGSGGRPAALPTEVRNHSAASRTFGAPTFCILWFLLRYSGSTYGNISMEVSKS